VDVRVVDMWKLAGEEANRAHRLSVETSGDELWGIRWLCQHNTYLFPRYYAGMGPVKLRLDGMTEWTYYGAASLGDGYDQLRSKEGCHYAYVGEDGQLLSTTTWEAVREGINDARYVATLRKLIEQAKQSGAAEQVALANEAEAALAPVLEQLPWDAGKTVPEVRLDEIRRLLSAQIVRLLEGGVTVGE